VQGVGGDADPCARSLLKRSTSWVGRSLNPLAMRAAPPARTKPDDSGSSKNSRRISRCKAVRASSRLAGPDVVDQRLPFGAEAARKDEFVPEVDEQGAVDDAFDVGRPAFPEDHFVGAGTLATIREVDRPPRAGPLQVDGQVESSERCDRREVRQPVWHGDHTGAAEVDLAPNQDRRGGQPVTGCGQDPFERLQRRRYPTVFVGGQRRAGRASSRSKLGDREACGFSDLRQCVGAHPEIVSDLIRNGGSSIRTVILVCVGAGPCVRWPGRRGLVALTVRMTALRTAPDPAC